LLKPRLSLVTENLALRQQLVVLRRNTRIQPGECRASRAELHLLGY